MSTDPVQEAIAHFGLNPTSVEPVEESYSSVVRILTLDSGERLVLKIPFVQRKLYRELHALHELRGDLPVPVVVDHWLRDDGGPGALLLSMLPGELIRGEVTGELARALGVLLGRVHRHKVPYYGELFETGEAAPEGWWALMRLKFQEWRPLCEGVMPRDLFRRTLDCYARLFAALPEPDGPRVVHSDYRPGNVLVQGTRITGLIDFESARGGPCDADFIKMKNDVWDIWLGTKETFLEGYASVRPLPDIERTLPFYALHNAFGGIAWCVRRSDTGDPFFQENMRHLEQALTELGNA